MLEIKSKLREQTWHLIIQEQLFENMINIENRFIRQAGCVTTFCLKAGQETIKGVLHDLVPRIQKVGGLMGRHVFF